MSTTTDTVDVAVEVAELRKAVVAMGEELDRRDVEQMEIESVVESYSPSAAPICTCSARQCSACSATRQANTVATN